MLQHNELYLDKAIEFDGPLHSLKGCPYLTGNIYLQRQREQNEIIIFKQDGTLGGRIDQSTNIDDFATYDSKVVLMLEGHELLFYNLAAKKVIRKIRLFD